MKMYIKFLPQSVSVMWVLSNLTDANGCAGGTIYSDRLNCVKGWSKKGGTDSDEMVQVCMGMGEQIRWVVDKTPIKAADEVYIDCREYKLVDVGYWRNLNVNGEILDWALPERNYNF